VVQKLKDGRGETEEYPRPGGPCTSKAEANIEKVGEII
jgi:hypothetical protein